VIGLIGALLLRSVSGHIAAHFQTGQKISVTRQAAHFRLARAMELVRR